MQRGELLSLGSLNVDVEVRAERLPSQGETVPGTDLVVVAGGKAPNVAYAARRLGAAARPSSRASGTTRWQTSPWRRWSAPVST